MATKLGLRLAPSACGWAARMPSIASRRTLSTLPFKRAQAGPLSQRIALRLPRASIQQALRRNYAEGPKASLTGSPEVTFNPPMPKPKRRFRIFRWLWRITYLSLLGSAAWFGYTIWDLQHPADQTDPDPSKKTLVVLGMKATSKITMLYSHPQVLVGALSLS